MNDVPLGLLPELWQVEIIGKHLARYTIRTRVSLRLTCRWFHAHVPPVPTDEAEFNLGLGFELRSWIRWKRPCAFLHWGFTTTAKETTRTYFFAMAACLQRGKFDVFHTMWEAFSNKPLLLAGWNGSTRMRLSIWLKSAVLSNSVTLAESYSALMEQAGYTIPPCRGSHMSSGLARKCYETVTWMLNRTERVRINAAHWKRIMRHARESTECGKIVWFQLLPKLDSNRHQQREVAKLIERWTIEGEK